MFATAKRSGRAQHVSGKLNAIGSFVLFISQHHRCRAVVTGKHNDRVLAQAEIIHRLQQPADAEVHAIHIGEIMPHARGHIAAQLATLGKLRFHLGPKLRFIHLHLGKPLRIGRQRLHWKVRDVAPDVQIKRLLFSGGLFEKCNRAIHQMRVSATGGLVVLFRGPIVINHINAIRTWLGIRPDVPFSKMPRAIAVALEQLGDGHRVTKAVVGHVFRKPSRMSTGHRPGSARTTGHTRDIRLCIARSLLGKLTQRRRLGIGMAIAAQIAIAEIISKDKDDVRFVVRHQAAYTSKYEPNRFPHFAAAFRAFWISALVLSEPSIGSTSCPSNSMVITPE